MIVKIQISQFDSEGRKRMLIYDRGRRYVCENDASPQVLKLMGDDHKKFFHAEASPPPNNDRHSAKFLIGEQAPWQDW
jgi:hypothetical protein